MAVTILKFVTFQG